MPVRIDLHRDDDDSSDPIARWYEDVTPLQMVNRLASLGWTSHHFIGDTEFCGRRGFTAVITRSPYTSNGDYWNSRVAVQTYRDDDAPQRNITDYSTPKDI